MSRLPFCKYRNDIISGTVIANKVKLKPMVGIGQGRLIVLTMSLVLVSD